MSFIYLLKKQWEYARGFDKVLIIIIYLFHTLAFGGIVIAPVIFRELINTLVTPEGLSIDGIGIYFFYLFLCWLEFEVFHRSARFLEYSAGGRIRENFVDHVYRHVYNLPLNWHQYNHSGDVINRIRLAGESLFIFIESQHQFIGIAALSIGPFISMVILAPDIIWLIILLMAVGIGANFAFDRFLVPVIRTKNDRNHSFSAILFDFISNIESLVTLGIGRLTENVLQERSRAVSDGYRGENRLNQLKCQVMSAIGFLLEFGLFAFFIFSREGSVEVVTVGLIIQVYQYCKMIKDSMFTFSGTYFDLVRWATDFSSVESILNTDPVRNGFIEGPLSFSGNIEISGLSFHYERPRDLKPSDVNQENSAAEPVTDAAELKKKSVDLEKIRVFDDFSLRLVPGEKVAITGSSGSGKSTLMKLLRGLYQPDSVSLSIDGISVSIEQLAGMITLVPQMPELFENTILYNITLGSSIDREELNRLIEVTQLQSVLDRFREGVNSSINEKGVNLSGGERQRIALARGLFAARNSPVILLDEVTSSIDMETEKHIYRNIFRYYQDRCILISVHRLYLLDMFDRVIDLGAVSALT